MGNWLLMPGQHFRSCIRAKHNSSTVITKFKVFSQVPEISPSLFEEVFEKMKWSEPGTKADISRLEALAVGKACYAYMQGYIPTPGDI